MIIVTWPLRFIRLGYQSALLALGQVWANKLRSILTALGIIIGVATVTAVIAAMTGYKTNVLNEFESFGTNKIFTWPDRPDRGRFANASWTQIRFTPNHFATVKEHCPSIEYMSRITRFSQPVRFGENTFESVRVTGIEPDWHKIENRSVIMGRPFSLTDTELAQPVCLITPSLRDKLRMDRDCTGQSVIIGGRRYLVVGVVEKSRESMFGGSSREEEVFVPFSTAWRLVPGFMYAMLTSRSPEVSDDARAELRFYLRQARSLKPDDPDTFEIEVMEQFLQQFKAIAGMGTAIAGAVVAMSLVVGGVGIMNIMLVSVSERTREIGLRKAVGARPSAILLQFLVEAVILCLVGGGVGILLGQGLISAVASIEQARLENAYIPLWAMGLSFGFATFIGIVFGMFPAIKAARLDPIEALRHE